MLRNVRESGERHNNTEEKIKPFIFYLRIVNLSTIIEFFR